MDGLCVERDLRVSVSVSVSEGEGRVQSRPVHDGGFSYKRVHGTHDFWFMFVWN